MNPIFALSISCKSSLYCFRNTNCSFINVSLLVVVLFGCLINSLSRILPMESMNENGRQLSTRFEGLDDFFIGESIGVLGMCYRYK